MKTKKRQHFIKQALTLGMHCTWYPQQELNLRTWIRNPMLYPLSYGGTSPGLNQTGFGESLNEQLLSRVDGASLLQLV